MYCKPKATDSSIDRLATGGALTLRESITKHFTNQCILPIQQRHFRLAWLPNKACALFRPGTPDELNFLPIFRGFPASEWADGGDNTWQTSSSFCVQLGLTEKTYNKKGFIFLLVPQLFDKLLLNTFRLMMISVTIFNLNYHLDGGHLWLKPAKIPLCMKIQCPTSILDSCMCNYRITALNDRLVFLVPTSERSWVSLAFPFWAETLTTSVWRWFLRKKQND